MNYKIHVHNQEIITESTMALLPHYTNTGHLHCTLLDTFGEIQVEGSTSFLLNESCVYYGGSFDGSLKSARRILKGQKNLPIMVSIPLEYCMIPLGSPMKKDTAWVAYQHIKDIDSNGSNSIIIFHNQVNLEVNISKSVLERRREKAAYLINTYQFRQKMPKNKKRGNMIAEEPEEY
ncbi:competence protein ComK [Metabacillus halosaccharovorans]|uniref:competence protein ComK n=1 Tax=Metabacillus halosaccharovorans TaxID=930124 RepID=UPI00203DD11A|nr:competence protein ComK [Metabacillus halosaccharovorans]MCM3443075.1 competence protein ComK [Metabacillus halosaccharovorans]